jgi:hypothetical protein
MCAPLISRHADIASKKKSDVDCCCSRNTMMMVGIGFVCVSTGQSLTVRLGNKKLKISLSTAYTLSFTASKEVAFTRRCG